MKLKNIASLAMAFTVVSVYSQNDSSQSISTNREVDSIHAYSVKRILGVSAKISPIDTIVRATPTSKKEQVYKLNGWVDIPIVVVGTGWSVYAFTKIYLKTKPTEEQLNSLDKNNINSFDRLAVYPYSQHLYNVSNYPFYGAMPLPFIFFLTGKGTRDNFAKLTFLYWEALSVTGLIGTAATYSVDRYRPYTYTTETTMDQRMSGNPKNSFYAGHVQVVATPTFFIAKVYADYHPHSKVKWVFYGLAAGITGWTAYLRVAAGQHFMSDVLLGTVVGAAAGILVPHCHRTNSSKNKTADIGLLPYSSGDINGLVLTCKFKK